MLLKCLCFADRIPGMEIITGAVRQFLNWLHIPYQLHLFVLLGLANIVSIAIGFLIGRDRGGVKAADRTRAEKPRTLVADRVDEFHEQMRILRDQNQHYRYFMVSLPRIMKNLNTTSDLVELSKSIVKLTSEALQTDTAHLYVCEKEGTYLKKMYAIGRGSEGIEGFEMGEGVVGRAASDLAVVDVEEEGARPGDGLAVKETGLSIAAPVLFEGVLVGVLGVGRITYPTGDERSLMKMVSEITGVSLYNRAFLGDAKKKATTDPLTGLYNRRHFFDMSREFVKKTAAHGGSISIFLFDIDSFKNYNDMNGHDEGDKLLKELGALVLEESRESNVVARYGGEEFIIMLNDVSKDGAVTYAQRLCEKIAAHPFAHREKQPLGKLSISGGLAEYPMDGDSIREVIRHADAALYRAKRRGRNRIEVHSPLLLQDEDRDEDGPAFPP
jgi:diguanylate cyclase (GGDEF)-like protein